MTYGYGINPDCHYGDHEWRGGLEGAMTNRVAPEKEEPEFEVHDEWPFLRLRRRTLAAPFGICPCGHEMDEHGCPLGH